MKVLGSKILRWLLGTVCALGVVAALVILFVPDIVRLLAIGDERPLKAEASARPPARMEPSLLFLALDGVDRALLYDMLRRGELPVLASLLFAEGRAFPHAHFDPSLVATMPSSTLAAWATVFTGVPPAVHGVAGNEFFIREQRRLAAPAPVSILNPEPVIETYTRDYANALLQAPTFYEQLERRRPKHSSWVSMSQFYRGASRLLLADRTVVADAFKALLSNARQPDRIYAELDEEVIDTLCDTLEKEPAPHVITLYLTGTDHYAHAAESGPDVARRDYLRRVLDPLLRRLKDTLDRQGALRERYVVLTSDHGHTQVLHEEKHALSTDLDEDPPAVLRGAGFRVRPFELEVDADQGYQAAIAYGGAVAYVYLADRSSCAKDGACDWSRPPRWKEDVLVVAEAFHQANSSGKHAMKLRGTLDLVLTRQPRPYAEDDLPFEVYVGDGKLEPIARHLERHPHPTYVDLEARLRDLAVGRFGERAGDLLLLAHNGDVDRPEQRYYFAGLYHSWHGSPSRRDSEVPLIVAHARSSSAELSLLTRSALRTRRQQDVTRLLLSLLSPGAAP